MNYKISDICKVIDSECVIRSDNQVSILLTDSRSLSLPEESLFFAIETKNNDGHKYIVELYNLKVKNFVVSKYLDSFNDMQDANFLIVKDTLTALQRLTAYHRSRFTIPVIGVTGSNGKTTVKEFLYQLLQYDYSIVRSPRSYNSQLGVPLSVWQMCERDTLAIFEAGISQCDEMDRIAEIIDPTIGILTNIGAAHQENFHSLEEKCLEKLKLFKRSKLLIYKKDDPIISKCIDKIGLSDIAIGWSYDDFPDNLEIPFNSVAARENIMHCITLIRCLNPALLEHKERFSLLEPVEMRLEVKEGINNTILINDTYNSDINSLAIALDFQMRRSIDKGLTKSVILSDILQSGSDSLLLYRSVADMLYQKGIDRLIGIGSDISANADLFVMEKEFFSTTDEFLESGRYRLFLNELILIKGSRSFHFESITELLVKKMHETILEVNLDAIVHNLNYYRSLLHSDTKIVCMVKAFGYGVGSYELAKTLQEHRCDYLAVAVADEGADLRRAGISVPIIVMNPEIGSLGLLFEHCLEPEIYNFRILESFIKEAIKRGVKDYPIHLKVDTGMHRLGFSLSDICKLGEILLSHRELRVRSMFSHLAGSDSADFDEFTEEQYGALKIAAENLRTMIGQEFLLHILNTAGIERFPQMQLNMVRLGIGLYGIGGCNSNELLRGVSSLKTVILQIKRVKCGETVGYSRKGIATKDMTIAILPIGYADGYDRRFGNGLGEVLVSGKRCPTFGNICMDITMIDITGVDAVEGEYVTVFGEGMKVEELAQRIDTIPYEILTSISPRVKRVYYRE